MSRYPKEILQEPNKTLRRASITVSKEEFSSPELDKVIKQMVDLLSKTDDGIALAAPQIGILKRIFVISPKIKSHGYKDSEPLVYINPVITKRSKKKVVKTQGCLSVEGIYGKVKRSQNITINAQHTDGSFFERGAGGLLAEICQHEVDHLDGKLFIDDAWDLHAAQTEDRITEQSE